MSLSEILARFGLDERDIAEAVAARLGPTASTGLPADQQALLEAGGLPFADAAKHAANAVADETALVATALTLPEGAVRMGVSASRVRHLVSDGGLASLRTSRAVLLPAWQFGSNGRPLPGLRAVLAAARDGEHPLAMQAFMTTPQLDLGGPNGQPMTPRDWLASGRPADEVAALLAGDVC